MIPCYIQNRDTLCAIQMAEKLASCDDAVPIIVDCGSTNPELEAAYKEAGRNGLLIHRVDAAHRNRAAWAGRSELGLPEPHGVYMATDGDLDVSRLPRDFLLAFKEVLLQNPEFLKVGCALQIESLPDESPIAAEVKAHEAQFWRERVGWLAHGFRADIDTTLALYRSSNGWDGYGPSVRMCHPYSVRHIPWHLTRENITPDWLYYFEHLACESGLGWTPKLKRYFCDATKQDC